MTFGEPSLAIRNAVFSLSFSSQQLDKMDDQDWSSGENAFIFYGNTNCTQTDKQAPPVRIV